MEEILQRELDSCYQLLQDTFSLLFPKPKLYYGNIHRALFQQMRGKRDFFWNPKMAYGPQLNGIYVPNQEPERPSAQRQYHFLHELGHSLIEHNSSMLKDAVVDEQKKNKQEQGYVSVAVHEGLADYMAIAATKNSSNFDLQAAGEERKKWLVQNLSDWISSSGFGIITSIYQTLDKADWRKTALPYFKESPLLLDNFRYICGYYFATNTSSSLQEILQNPPASIPELLFPEKFKSESHEQLKVSQHL